MTRAVAGCSEAFLSYTRIDDEYFGGAITSLRRLLQLGVQVVTGDPTFHIFQDVEGIEFGQKWNKRLTDAVSTSRFMIPIITPLFFQSDPCRDELSQFIRHEKDLGRDDLILPIYFVTTPALERRELLRNDVLASEIGSRQRYDWRIYAETPLDDPLTRRAVRELVDNIAAAIARTSGSVAASHARRRSDDAHDEASRLLQTLGQERETKKYRKLVLWVDDRPDNNLIERNSLAAYNIRFVLARSTAHALAELKKQQFDAIVSDMGRPPDSQAGYTLLEAIRRLGDQTPYFIYAGSKAPAHVLEARRRGAQGTTNLGDELLQMLLQTLDV